MSGAGHSTVSNNICFVYCEWYQTHLNKRWQKYFPTFQSFFAIILGNRVLMELLNIKRNLYPFSADSLGNRSLEMNLIGVRDYERASFFFFNSPYFVFGREVPRAQKTSLLQHCSHTKFLKIWLLARYTATYQ